MTRCLVGLLACEGPHLRQRRSRQIHLSNPQTVAVRNNSSSPERSRILTHSALFGGLGTQPIHVLLLALTRICSTGRQRTRFDGGQGHLVPHVPMRTKGAQ